MQLYNTVKRTQKTCRINYAANLYIWSQHFDSLLRKTLRYTFSWCAMMPFNGKISLPKVKSHPLWAASTSHCDRLQPSMTSIGLFFKIEVDVHDMDWREKKKEWTNENTAVNPVRTENWLHLAVQEIITDCFDSHWEITDRGMASAWIDLEAGVSSGDRSTQKMLTKEK